MTKKKSVELLQSNILYPSCSLSSASWSADEPAGSSEAKVFPFGCFRRVIPLFRGVYLSKIHTVGNGTDGYRFTASPFGLLQLGYLAAPTKPALILSS